jgi:hypothetical protein
MARSNRRRGRKMPGVSINTSWLWPSIAIPRIWVRVVCTLWETIVTLAPTSAFTRVDLPALVAPMTEMKPHLVGPSGTPDGVAGFDFTLATVADFAGVGFDFDGGFFADGLAAGPFVWGVEGLSDLATAFAFFGRRQRGI